MRKKYIALISILSVFVIMAITAAILFFTKPPSTVEFDQALLEEIFSGKIEFPANTIVERQKGLVYENGKFRAEIDSISGRFFSEEEIANGIPEEHRTKRIHAYELSDGSFVSCDDWFLLENGWHFYNWTIWQDKEIEDGMRYQSKFEYLKGDHSVTVSLRCTDPRDTENMRALYTYIASCIQENIVDLVQWQKEHGYDIQE